MEPTLDNILKCSTAARELARRVVECSPKDRSSLNRFEKEVQQAQNELTLRIRPEIYGKTEEPGESRDQCCRGRGGNGADEQRVAGRLLPYSS